MNQPVHLPRTTGDVLRIGGACAFWGDTNEGVRQLVHAGDVDVLVFDYLAELTLSLMAAARTRKPELGYATDFVSAVEPLLPDILQKGIRLLSNAGGMNPQACATALRAAAERQGVSLKVAVVEGDDLMAAQDTIRGAATREMFSGAPMPATLTSLNAYLGAFPVVAALASGADVVITGRCVDSALALAALIHRFGWRADDYDRLASGSLVGHLIECSTQATGGLFTDWWKVPGWENMGFPIAECSAGGDFVLTKTPGTGGLVTELVAAEQLLYEVTDPGAYALPDVVCDFTAVRLRQVGQDRVAVTGAKGSAPGASYKVSGTWLDGFRVSATLTIVGDDAVAKARRLADAILDRTRTLMARDGFGDYAEVHYEILGSELVSYGEAARPDAREVVLRLAARHEKAAALAILAREVAPFGVSAAPGTTGFSGRQKAAPVFRLFSFLWDKSRVPVSVVDDKGRRTQVALAATIPADSAGAPVTSSYGSHVLQASDLVEVPLSAVAVARSGDKGDVAHLCLISRLPEFLPYIGAQVDAASVKRFFAHLVDGDVKRFDVPGIHAYNYVMTRALGGGGAGSLRNDPLGKTFGQILLSRPVRIPRALLAMTDRGYRASLQESPNAA